MGTKIEKWMADDGTEFASEDDMLAYESDASMRLDVERWLASTPDLSEAAKTRRANTVMAFMRWQVNRPFRDGLPNEPAAEEDPEADQDLAAAA